MRNLIEFLKVKWIHAECRNICKCCKYRNVCDLYFVFIIQPRYDKKKSKLDTCYGMKVDSISGQPEKNNRGN